MLPSKCDKNWQHRVQKSSMQIGGKEWNQEEASPLRLRGKRQHMWESSVPLEAMVSVNMRKWALGSSLLS